MPFLRLLEEQVFFGEVFDNWFFPVVNGLEEGLALLLPLLTAKEAPPARDLIDSLVDSLA